MDPDDDVADVIDDDDSLTIWEAMVSALWTPPEPKSGNDNPDD